MLKCYMISRQRGRAHNRFRVTRHGTCTRKDKGNWWGKEQGPLARKKPVQHPGSLFWVESGLELALLCKSPEDQVLSYAAALRQNLDHDSPRSKFVLWRSITPIHQNRSNCRKIWRVGIGFEALCLMHIERPLGKFKVDLVNFSLKCGSQC